MYYLPNLLPYVTPRFFFFLIFKNYPPIIFKGNHL